MKFEIPAGLDWPESATKVVVVYLDKEGRRVGRSLHGWTRSDFRNAFPFVGEVHIPALMLWPRDAVSLGVGFEDPWGFIVGEPESLVARDALDEALKVSLYLDSDRVDPEIGGVISRRIVELERSVDRENRERRRAEAIFPVADDLARLVSEALDEETVHTIVAAAPDWWIAKYRLWVIEATNLINEFRGVRKRLKPDFFLRPFREPEDDAWND